MKKRDLVLIAFLIGLILVLVVVAKISDKERIKEILIENNTIYLDNLTMRQKIAQMFMVRGDERNLDLIELNIGGILLGELNTKEDYKEKIKEYQENSKIKLFVSADLEGYWNPFSNFIKFPNIDEIKTKEEAYDLGIEHGKILQELGFNMNFAPVAEIEDNVWKHRAFSGSPEEISEKVNFYIKGIQEQGIKATAKHYPGGSLDVKDPHKYLVEAEISQEQLDVFNSVLENVSAIMVGHPIVSGVVDSKGKPSSVSLEIISELKKKFDGLIISDDINMKGLKKEYFLKEKQLFIDLINAGNDIIINSYWHLFPKHNLNKKISYIEEAIKLGKIKEDRINESVRRILTAKGYNVI